MILPGVTVGEAAVVAARSVVTRNVEPFSVVAGNPARKIGNREIINFAYLPSSWFGAICAWVDRNPSIKEMQNSNIKGTAQ
jgi:chloramphenicol O-acetyltransferase type B